VNHSVTGMTTSNERECQSFSRALKVWTQLVEGRQKLFL